MSLWNPLQLIRARRGGKHVGLPALATCRALMKVIAGLQQHRGASSAWLAGDRAFETRMRQRRQEIDDLLPALRPGFQCETEEACPCCTMNDWKLFQFKWREMVERLPQSTVQENIEAHNQLIARLLDWLADLGESRLELPAGELLPIGAVRNFAIHLPVLAECLGQARAIGSSVAAKGGCAPVARVRLTFLAARAEALLQRASALDRGSGVQEAAEREVRTMAAMVRNELLAGSGVRISSERYFATATRAIDAVFTWIEASGNTLERGLQGSRLTRGAQAPELCPAAR